MSSNHPPAVQRQQRQGRRPRRGIPATADTRHRSPQPPAAALNAAAPLANGWLQTSILHPWARFGTAKPIRRPSCAPPPCPLPPLLDTQRAARALVNCRKLASERISLKTAARPKSATCSSKRPSAAAEFPQDPIGSVATPPPSLGSPALTRPIPDEGPRVPPWRCLPRPAGCSLASDPGGRSGSGGSGGAPV